MRVRSLLIGTVVAALTATVLTAPASAATGSPQPTESASAEDSAITITAASATDLRAAASARVSQWSTREQAAAIVMAHIPTADPSEAAAFMADTGVGGFIVMGANVAGSEGALRDFVRALTVDRALPPLVAIDQEGGVVSRLPWDGFLSARSLAAGDDAEVSSAFAGRGALVQRVGIDVNFGIVADWTDDPASFIYSRVLGHDPTSASDHVAAATTAEHPFVASTLKHFPGHGAAPGDSHRMIPSTDMSEQQWRDADAAPFRGGVDAGAPLVMFGHLAYTAIDPAPASLSTTWHRILRDDLGFTGVAVTDDMNMLVNSGLPEYQDPAANAVAALRAGNDLILGVGYSSTERVAEVVDAIASAVESGDIDADRLTEAAERVTALRLSAAVAPALACGTCAAVAD